MLRELENDLIEYYSVNNEIKAGLNTQPAEKPYELILYEQVNDMHIPLVAGGLMDQPHIWIEQYAIVRNIKAIFDAQALQAELDKEKKAG